MTKNDVKQELQMDKITFNKAVHLLSYEAPYSNDYFRTLGRLEQVSKDLQILEKLDGQEHIQIDTYVSVNGDYLEVNIKRGNSPMTKVTMYDDKLTLERVEQFIKSISECLK